MNTFVKTYKDLIFWKKAFEVSKSIFKLSNKLPQSQELKIILNQLFRSSMSVGANIAEGFGRYGSKEYSRFLRVALGSANETDYWLTLLMECTSGTRGEIEGIVYKNTEVIKLLATSIKTIKSKVK